MTIKTVQDEDNVDKENLQNVSSSKSVNDFKNEQDHSIKHRDEQPESNDESTMHAQLFEDGVEVAEDNPQDPVSPDDKSFDKREEAYRDKDENDSETGSKLDTSK